MNSNVKTAVFWVVIIMVVVLLWTVVRQSKSPHDQTLSFTQLMTEVENERVKSVTITGGSGEMYRREGAYAKAEPIYLQVVQIRTRTGRDKDVYFASTLYHLARAYQASDRVMSG